MPALPSIGPYILSVLALVLCLTACGDDSAADAGFDAVEPSDARISDVSATEDIECLPPAIPSTGARFSLTAAGAPVSLFGPSADPTFEEGFGALVDAGFTRLFPLFLTREIVDRPEGDTTPSLSSGHDAFFFAESCDGGSAFAAASEAGLEILFPAFFFFPEGDLGAFDEVAFQQRFEAYQRDCFSEHEDVITAYYNYDEMSSNWAGVELVNRAFGGATPLPRVDNAAALATAMRGLSDAPVYAVDGPAIPLLERDRSAIEGAGVDLDALLADYDTQLRAFASSSDVFGFDAYPIPESYWFPITTSGDLVRVAREVAPDARVMAVLQGMSYDAQGGHTGIGASGPPPTLDQTRFMAFDAIVNGAEELLWYGPNFLDLEQDTDREFWIQLQSVVGELSSMGHALASPRRTLALEEQDLAAVAFEILHGELVIVVNRATTEVSATLPLPPGTRLIPYPTGEAEDDFSLTLAPLEVQVFLTTTCD